MHMQHAQPQLGQHASLPLLVVLLHLALETATIAGANQMHMPSLVPLTKSHPCIYVVLHIAMDCYERLLQSSGPQQMNVCGLVCGHDSYLFPT